MTSDVLVLCYHALSPTWAAALSITPTRFERQLATLSARGYRCVTFSEAASAPPEGRVAAITFDDAFRSVIALARPILDRFGFPATVFAPTDLVDAESDVAWPGVERWLGGPSERELALMSWAELRALADGGWEVGSHTATHARLTELADDVLDDELVRSKAECERHLDRDCSSLAYPYGDVDARVIAATARAGYRVAGALPGARLGANDPMAWPRIGIYHGDHDVRFKFKVSPATRRVRRWPRAGGPR
jgi:peptidoglycan/xylan/chitin deacetylase (PgdA/CDA1 family)